MTRQQLIAQIRHKRSFLCIGLDTDPGKLPESLLNEDDPVLSFNKQIIDATHHLCVAYKLNTAFYESRGLAGWKSLIATCNYLPKDCFTIADAKRGDIGNTSEMYAKAFFDPVSSGMNFDAITVAPYMGADSVTPFLKYEGKWVILLALTSNPGNADFQRLAVGGCDTAVYQTVITKANTWASAAEMMYVVGATNGPDFSAIRKLAPNHFLLVPGVGAQGGDLADICKRGMNSDCGLLVNASRSVIYASGNADFAEAAAHEAEALQKEMEKELVAINFF